MQKISEKLILFPFGASSREALPTILALNEAGHKIELLGFIDDDKSKTGLDCCGYKVLGGREILAAHPEAKVMILQGSPASFRERDALIDSFNLKDEQFLTLVHPNVVQAPDAKVGINTLVMQGCSLSVNSKVGNHCVMLPNTVLSHDSILGNYTMTGSLVSIAGLVNIGEKCYLGTQSSFKETISVGAETLIGMGSVVVCDIPEKSKALGVPAKIINGA